MDRRSARPGTPTAANRRAITTLLLALGVSACGDEEDTQAAAIASLAACDLDSGVAQPGPETSAERDASVLEPDGASAQPATDQDAGETSPRETAPRVLVGGGNVNNRRCKVSLRPDGESGDPELVVERLSADLSGDRSVAVCIVPVKVTPPPGHTFALESASGTGEVSLPEGATAAFSISYGPIATLRHSNLKSVLFDGPLEGPVHPQLAFKGNEQVFWPCGSEREMDLRLDLRLYSEADSNVGHASWTGLRIARFVTRPCAE